MVSLYSNVTGTIIKYVNLEESMARIKNATFLQRQKIAVIGFAVIVAAGFVWLMSLVVTERVSGEFIEGEDYLVLEEPRRVRGDAIEIMEFFSYGCIHCYSLDPRLDDLIEELTGEKFEDCHSEKGNDEEEVFEDARQE